MGWGGARQGAGRPKAKIPKKYRGIRLTDDEWDFVKEAVKQYRQEETTEQKAAPAPGIQEKTRQDNNGVGLLAHLEALYHQEYTWLREYTKYLKGGYDKYTLEEINLQRELIQLQIVTLLPHLNHFTFSYEVQMACSPKGKAYINASQISEINKDIEIEAWQEPDRLDYTEENIKLTKMYKALQQEREKIKELEHRIHDL